MWKPRGRRVEIRGFLPPFLVLISSLWQGILTAGSRDKTSPLIPEDLDRGLGDRLARFSRHTTASTSGQKECRERRRDARRTGEQEEALGYRNCNTVGHGLEPASVTAFNDLCNNESRLSMIFATMRWTVDNCKLAVSVFRTRARINYPATRDLTLNWHAAD